MQSEPSTRFTSSSDSSSPSGRKQSPDISRRPGTGPDDLRQPSGESNQLTLPDELCEELQAAVENAALRSAGSIGALRLAVTRFTVALRDEGAKPEAVLIAIKSVINFRTFAAIGSVQDWKPDELRQKISSWSIEDFFSEKRA